MSQSEPRRMSDRSASGKRSAVRRRVRRPKIEIQIDERDNEATLFERLKRGSVGGVPGLLVSLTVHFLILLVMALIVIAQPSSDDVELEFGWSVPKSQRQTLTAPRRPFRLKTELTQSKRSKKVNKTETKPDDSAIVTVRPVDVEKSLSGRGERVRGAILSQYGESEKIERAISSGLTWIQRQQHSDGHWQLQAKNRNLGYPDPGYPDAGYVGLKTDTGATALALLAFLGDGQTHQAGPYQETIEKGLRWLKGIQKSDGDLHDWNELGRSTAFYAHSQATIALCEAYALTGDESLREPAELAVKFLIDSQHPTKGGWRYQPQNELAESDLSVTGWGLMALNTARMAGLDVADEAFQRVSVFLDSVQEMGGSQYKYLPSTAADTVTPAMTAEGLLCRQWLGWPKDHPPMKAGARFILRPEHAPQWAAGKRNVYAWYYTAQFLHNSGGKPWKQWYQAVQQEIVSMQTRTGSRKRGGDVRGSWHPTKPLGSSHEYGEQGGRLYVTAMCLLILETPFRHSPVYPDDETP